MHVEQISYLVTTCMTHSNKNVAFSSRQSREKLAHWVGTGEKDK